MALMSIYFYIIVQHCQIAYIPSGPISSYLCFIISVIHGLRICTPYKGLTLAKHIVDMKKNIKIYPMSLETIQPQIKTWFDELMAYGVDTKAIRSILSYHEGNIMTSDWTLKETLGLRTQISIHYHGRPICLGLQQNQFVIVLKIDNTSLITVHSYIFYNWIKPWTT